MSVFYIIIFKFTFFFNEFRAYKFNPRYTTLPQDFVFFVFMQASRLAFLLDLTNRFLAGNSIFRT